MEKKNIFTNDTQIKLQHHICFNAPGTPKQNRILEHAIHHYMEKLGLS
jgi:hypothetical protein